MCAVGITNRGKMKLLDYMFINAGPSNFFVALVTNAAVPNVDVNTMNELTEITAGNGYTSGGYELSKGSDNFDTIGQDQSENRGEIELKDVVWTADAAPGIPNGGDGARYAVLTDYNANVLNRQIFAWWDLTSDRSVSNGQSLTLQDCELRLVEA